VRCGSVGNALIMRVRRSKPGIAVVTGGTAGVGRATVREFARRGWDVGVLARGRAGLDATTREVADAGQRCVAVPVNVADAEGVLAAAARIEDELGPIDVWVNNAFAGFIGRFLDITYEEFGRVTDVTYHGQVNGTRAALGAMLPRDRGVIIQVGSALAHRGIPLQSAYCGAKHAIAGFTESVRTELMHDRSHVKVCMVDLPALNTPQFDWVLRRVPKAAMPVPPIYQPEVAARAIVHVADHPRRSAWVGLPTVLTILGNRLAPGLIDRYLARTGFDAQQSDDRPPPTEPPNLFRPADTDHGAHGAYDDKAHETSAQAWVSRHRAVLGLATATGAATAALTGRRMAR
jgi:NAD(P)-dependent dehydrogenase (short-subunit alcohol dehydrogenase family)